MRGSIRTGFSFGITSGIITTLGPMVGLHSGTHSKLAALGGILTIAVADAFSDALGIHIERVREQALHTRDMGIDHRHLSDQVRLHAHLRGAGSAVPPQGGDNVSLAWGLSLLGIFSYLIAKQQKVKPFMAVAEHLIIAIAVISINHYPGDWIGTRFG